MNVFILASLLVLLVLFKVNSTKKENFVNDVQNMKEKNGRLDMQYRNVFHNLSPIAQPRKESIQKHPRKYRIDKLMTKNRNASQKMAETSKIMKWNTHLLTFNRKNRVVKRNSDFLRRNTTTNGRNPTIPSQNNWTITTPDLNRPTTHFFDQRHSLPKATISILPPRLIPKLYPECSSDKTCERRCTNTTQWRTQNIFTCFCDPDCYEVFNDCCSDYVKFCGFQNPKSNPKKKFIWECVNHPWPMRLDEKRMSDGVWMVTQCAPDWPQDHIRKSCRNPKIDTRSPDIYRTVPILNRGNITFRNVYCALCNHAASTIDQWTFDVATDVLPPTYYNLTEQIRFYLDHNAQFRQFRPEQHQPRRYCIKKIIDTCIVNNQSCKDGTVEVIITPEKRHYINMDCALCNGVIPSQLYCFPKFQLNLLPRIWPFSIVLNFGRFRANQRSLTISGAKCSNGLVFDEILQICTINCLHPSQEVGPEKYYVISWLQTVSRKESLSKEIVRKSFLTHFELLPENFDLNEIKWLKDFFLVKSTLILTPEQSLELRSKKYGKNVVLVSKLTNFIHFKTTWSLKIMNRTYTVFKTTSRPLKCFGRISNAR